MIHSLVHPARVDAVLTQLVERRPSPGGMPGLAAPFPVSRFQSRSRSRSSPASIVSIERQNANRR